MSLIIRQETLADVGSLYDLVESAFGRAAEAELLNLLRADDALLLSHVALLKGEIVGQAAYSLLTISDSDSRHCQPALGPIAVSPACQGQGVGGALVRAGIEAMSDAGYGLLFLVGHVSYYPRFGFVPAVPLGFSIDYFEPQGAHEPFMVKVLDARIAAGIRGHVRFHPAFDAV